MNQLIPLDEKRMQELALLHIQQMTLGEVSMLDAEGLQYAEEHFDSWDTRNAATVMSKAFGITVDEAFLYLKTLHSVAITTARSKLAEKVAAT